MATPEEQAKFRTDAFELAWRHVERAPVTEDLGPHGKGIIFDRTSGSHYWYHGRSPDGDVFRVHSKSPSETRVIGRWEPGVDTTLKPIDFCTNCSYSYSTSDGVVVRDE